MALFKKLKKDIGIEEEEKKKKEKKEKKKKKESKHAPVKPVAEKLKKEAPEKKVPEKKQEDKKEEIKNIPMSKKNNSDWLKSKGQLAVDVYQTEDTFCVQAPIAGVNQSNLDIAIENDMLVIKGERDEPNQDKDKKYICQECYWGPFSREVMLPEDLKADKIKASLKNGILLVTIPKSKAVKKKITVQID